ncbi:MAG TPA: hypothetical protein PLV68_13545, partial [Ilumatobacteraceae bacterium]|nr:hypothetical protein [Ilumatobacteraceae bacterium]
GTRMAWFRDAVAQVRAVNDRLAVKLVPLAIGAMGVLQLGIPVVIAAVAYRVSGGQVSVAIGVSFLVLILRVYGPLLAVAVQVESLRLADASLE